MRLDISDNLAGLICWFSMIGIMIHCGWFVSAFLLCFFMAMAVTYGANS